MYQANIRIQDRSKEADPGQTLQCPLAAVQLQVCYVVEEVELRVFVQQQCHVGVLLRKLHNQASQQANMLLQTTTGLRQESYLFMLYVAHHMIVSMLQHPIDCTRPSGLLSLQSLQDSFKMSSKKPKSVCVCSSSTCVQQSSAWRV